MASSVPAVVAAQVAAQEEQTRIALLPIVVHSAESPDYLRNGLADMLSSRFEASGRFELIRIDEPEQATTEIRDARKRAEKVGAEYVLFGSFTQFGLGASLDMQCAPTTPGRTSKPLREIFVHSGSIGEVIPDLDDLVGKVTRYVSGGGVPPTGPPPQPGAPPATAVNEGELEELRLRVESLEARLGVVETTPVPASAAASDRIE